MQRVTLIPGDGVGPEVTTSMRRIVEATGVPIDWELVNAGAEVLEKEGTPLPDSVLDSIRRNKVAIKGPVTTPVGTGFQSVNVQLRKALDLYACLRPTFALAGVKTNYPNLDLVVVRENTEDLYAGIERQIDPDTAESIKRITRKGSERVARFAFEYALREGRKKVTAVHKANIMKLSDGLFLESARKIAESYPQIQFEDRIVDNMCMQLVIKPDVYDVILAPNLYGDILSDLCAGLMGGLGLAPGANIGDEFAVFEPVHGSAPKYAGANKIDPAATIFSAVLMLKHLNEEKAAAQVFQATTEVIKEGKYVTYDLGGTASTTEMTEAIINKILALARTSLSK